MKNKMSKRDIQRDKIAAMSLEERTHLYWHVSRAVHHPKAPALSAEEVIAHLSDIEEYTSLQKALGNYSSELLDIVIHGGTKREPSVEIKPATANKLYGTKADYIIMDDPEPPYAA